MEIIDNSIKKECKCKGKTCKCCTNGVYKESNYTLVAETSEGQKIAFQMDFIK